MGAGHDGAAGHDGGAGSAGGSGGGAGGGGGGGRSTAAIAAPVRAWAISPAAQCSVQAAPVERGGVRLELLPRGLQAQQHPQRVGVGLGFHR